MLKRTAGLLGPFLWRDRQTRVRCGLAAATLFLDIAATTALPYAFKGLVDTLEREHPVPSVLVSILGVFGLLWVLQKTINEVQELLFFPIVNEAIRQLGHQAVMHAHAIELDAYNKLSVPKLISSIRRISSSARGFLKLVALQLIPMIAKLGVTLWGVIRLGFGELAAMLLVAVGIIAWGTWRYAQTRQKAWDRSDRMNAAVHDSLLNTLYVRSCESFESASLKTFFDEEARCWQYANTRMHAVQLALGMLFGVTAAVALGLSAHRVSVGALTLGGFVLLKSQLLALWLPLKQLSLGCRHAVEAAIDLKKIFALMDTPKRERPQALTLVPCADWVLEAMDVSFSYSDDEVPLIHSLSLRLDPGSCTLVYGPSGCGKSTLASLLAGLRSPSSGRLRWAGLPLERAPDSHRKKLLYIPQQAHILNASVRQNLLYGLEEPPQEEELVDAIEAMGLSHALSQLRQGLETQLGELGVRLSGGERQRLMLARAYLQRPQLLILDETLHALDVYSEAQILKKLKARIPTLLIISHRDSCLPYTTQSLCLSPSDNQEVLKRKRALCP